jgi:S1-C subfamily serine protease
MKKFIIQSLSGIFGGVLVLTAFLYINRDRFYTSNSTSALVHPVNQSVYVNAPQDFTVAAEKALNVVVQINAQESEKLARQKMEENNPFKGNPLFRDFDMRGFGFFNPYYQQKKGSGSGVIYSQDGYIVTNNHVVEFADDIEVILKDGRKFKAKKVGTDPRTDLAVLKIESSDLPVLQIANSDEIKVGEWVLAVGNPFGYLTSTVTAGIVSAKGRDLNILDQQNDEDNYFNPYQNRNNPPSPGIEEFIQTDAAVNPGNSGGALVDVNGRLVGINSAIASKTGYYSGYSFAIPSNLVAKIVGELIKNGTFERGRFGVGVVNVDEDLKKQLNLNDDKGVVITELEEKGSAKYAGLLPNDVIIEINNKAIKTVEDLQKVVALSKIGETLYTKIIRDGQIKEIPVKIKKMI